ncbi:MAG: NAD-dependent epimerase/dehydratase family protein [Puniceicoccaceae bacterium]
MMKILVTGGGGFLGRYIVRELIGAGHRVVSLQRSAHPDLEELGVTVVCGSLLDTDAVRTALSGCQAVIHTAAKAGVWGSRSDFFATNVDGTRELLHLMNEEGADKLVYCSSPSVVFNGGSFNGADESLPYGCNWHCPYPESKALAEQMVLAWGREGRGRVIALRPHLMWGIGDPHVLPPVIRRSEAGRLRIVGDGKNRIDMTRVENSARAHLLALQALEKPSAVNRPYFLSQGQPVVLWEWLNDILKGLGMPQLQKRISHSAAFRIGGICEFAWRLLGKESIPPMTRFVAQQMAKSHWFSIEAARRELDYRPEAFPSSEGMERYLAAWKEGKTPHG